MLKGHLIDGLFRSYTMIIERKNIQVFIFIAVLLSALLPTVIAGKDLPDGLFWAKELIFLLINALVVLLISKTLLFKIEYLKIQLVDVLVAGYFIYSILNSLLTFPISGFPPNIFINLAMIYTYIGVRLNSKNFEITKSIFITTILIFFIAQVVYGISQKMELIKSYNLNFPVTGAFFNPAPYSLMLCLFLPVICIFFRNYTGKSIIRSLVLFVFISLSLYLVYICFSRGNWLALIFTFTLFIILEHRGTIQRAIKNIIIPFAIFIIPIAWLLYYLKPVSANGRLLIWQISYKVVSNNILWGVGEGNFPLNFLEQQHNFFKDLKNIDSFGFMINDIRFAFNDILQIQAETGIIGLILFMSILFQIIKILLLNLRCAKGNIELKRFSLILLMVISIQFFAGLVSYPLSILPFKILLVIIFAMTVNSSTMYSPSKYYTINLTRKSKFFFAIVSVVISISTLWHVFKTYNALDLWRESVVYSEKQQLSILKSIKDRLGNNGYFLFFLGDSYFRNKDYPKAIQNLKKAKLLYPDKEVFLKLALAYMEDKQISSAEAEYKYLIQSYPAEIDLYYQLGYFYLQIDNNKSLEELKEKVISLKNNSASKSYETTRKKILQL